MACVNTMLIPDAQLWNDDKWHPVVKDQNGMVRWSDGGGHEEYKSALGVAQVQVQVIAYQLRHQLQLPFVLERGEVLEVVA